MYRSTAPGGNSSWSTREIAALNFLLGIPLEAERSIIRHGLGEDSSDSDESARNEYGEDPSSSKSKVKQQWKGKSNSNSSRRRRRRRKRSGKRFSEEDEERGGMNAYLDEDEKQELIMASLDSSMEDSSSSLQPLPTSMSSNTAQKQPYHKSNPFEPYVPKQGERGGWWNAMMREQQQQMNGNNTLESSILEHPNVTSGSATTTRGTGNTVIDTSTNASSSTTDLEGLEMGTLSTNSSNPNIQMLNTSYHPNSITPNSTTTRRTNKFYSMSTKKSTATPNSHPLIAPQPGRRLEGIEATTIRIPLENTSELKTVHRTVARNAAVREWEKQLIHNTPAVSIQHPLPPPVVSTKSTRIDQFVWRNNNVNSHHHLRPPRPHPPPNSLDIIPSKSDDGSTTTANQHQNSLLNGRIFMSALGSYPLSVYSIIKYEPKKEEVARQRKKIEELGGGGIDFCIPHRDWRGISYRMLLPRNKKKNKAFNRMLRENRKKSQKIALMRKRRRRKKRLKKREDLRKSGSFGSAQEISEDDLTDEDGDLLGDDDEDTDDDIADDDDDLESEFDTQVNTDKLLKNEDDDNKEGKGEKGDDGNENKFDSDDLSSSSSDESTTYKAGFLDDPQMVQGRHRHVMVGDRVTGCVVSSIIHFVRPTELKADLNKQFRQRFDQWEPPKSQRKLIGAKVVDGVYTLIDPTETAPLEDKEKSSSKEEDNNKILRSNSKRKSSISSAEDILESTIRMPPSLTLSKIRKLKRMALLASIRAKLEVSTVALACVYFERLCLDCRVDKSNRRLSFAACLLIAAKINEANVALVQKPVDSGKESKKKGGGGVIENWMIKRTKKHHTIFALLLEFFTHEWSISLKALFAAEWGVFAALGFELHASVSQVAFHFKRLMKALEWSPINYLGQEMYNQWQETVLEDSLRKEQKQTRREGRRNLKDKKLLKLQRELQISKRSFNSNQSRTKLSSDDTEQGKAQESGDNIIPASKAHGRTVSGLLNRMGLKKTAQKKDETQPPMRSLLPRSLSSPCITLSNHGKDNSSEGENLD